MSKESSWVDWLKCVNYCKFLILYSIVSEKKKYNSHILLGFILFYWQIFLFKVPKELKDGTGSGLSSSGAINSSYQRSLWQTWWWAWTWFPLCAMVLLHSSSRLPFFACATARCSLRNQDKGFFSKTKIHNQYD